MGVQDYFDYKGAYGRLCTFTLYSCLRPISPTAPYATKPTNAPWLLAMHPHNAGV